jgi:predicted MFS family arabinose efflux permease
LATVVNIFYFDYNAVYLSLVALGAGWNLMYVGGGALLSKHLVGQDRYRWQGVNDTAIALCATIGAFFPAPLFSWIGWEHTNEWILFFTACVALFCFYMVFRFDNASKREIGT